MLHVLALLLLSTVTPSHPVEVSTMVATAPRATIMAVARAAIVDSWPDEAEESFEEETEAVGFSVMPDRSGFSLWSRSPGRGRSALPPTWNRSRVLRC